MKNKYPIYVVSKNRWDKCLTVEALNLIGADYKVIVEEEQFENYANVIGPEKLLVLPKVFLDVYETMDDLFDTKSKGPGAARNFAMKHAYDAGFKRHWVLDDNIRDFHRLHNNMKVCVRSTATFRAAEDFVDRFSNVPLAGMNYSAFCKTTDKILPFIANTRIYSCLLIDNNIKYDWRGRYNEDTDLSLRVLKDGDCTISFNAFLCEKVTTQRMRGGNSDEFYDKEGTKPKSQMLVNLHPDVSEMLWKFNRWHHKVDYKPFKNNQLKLIDKDIVYDKVDNYGMVLGEGSVPRKDETREIVKEDMIKNGL